MNMDHRQKRAFALASEDVGLKEVRGPKHNSKIVQDFATVGHSWVKDDETAWCASFVGARLEDAGLPSTRKLNARSYLDWGEGVTLAEAVPGDVVVFWRGSPSSWQGHVGFFVDQGDGFIHVLGGNQSNAVNVSKYAASRLLGVRRWPVSVPVMDQHTARKSAGSGWLASLFKALMGIFGGKK